MKIYKGDIPFEKAPPHSMLGLFHRNGKKADYIWRPNYVFSARMRFTTCWDGGVRLVDAGNPSGPEYFMTMNVFMQRLDKVTITKGVTEMLDWTFYKRGMSYNIIPTILL